MVKMARKWGVYGVYASGERVLLMTSDDPEWLEDWLRMHIANPTAQFLPALGSKLVTHDLYLEWVNLLCLKAMKIERM